MEQIIKLLWNMSYRASIVIMIVLLIRGILLRKFPRRYAFWLWGIVGLCLLLPVGIKSSVSIFNILPDGNQVAQILSEQSADENDSAARGLVKDIPDAGQINSAKSNTEAASAKVDIVSDKETGKNQDKSAVQDKDGTQEAARVNQEREEDGEEHSLAQEETAGEHTEQGMMLYQFLFCGWLFGVLVLFLWNLAGWMRIKRQVKSAILLEGNVYECEDIPGPFVLGIISPKIYIPFRIEEEARGYILAHERYHIKRRDYLTKMIAAAILAVYWFHPFVWAAYILMGRDMEMSCDEHVLEGADVQMRVKYSESLLSFATNRRSWNAQRMAFDAHTTRRRVKNVLAGKKSKRYMGIVFGVVVVIAAVVLLTQGTKGRFERPDQETIADKDLTELTAFVELSSNSGLQKGWFGELLKQRFHVKLNIQPFNREVDGISGSDILVWGDKNNKMTGAISIGYEAAKNQGKLLPLSDGEYGRVMTVSDAYHDDIFYTWDLRYDLYQKCGKPRIKDLDDLCEVLKAMQNVYKGEEKVYGASAWSTFDETNMAYAGMLCSGYYGLAMNDFVLYDNEGNVYDILDRTQPYIQALRFLNQLYRDGLLDPDSRTDTFDEASAKASKGQVLWSLTDYAGSSVYNTRRHLDAGTAMYPVVPEDAVLLNYKTVMNRSVIAVNADSAHGDLCRQIVEYLSSPQGMMEATYGPEGLCWYYDEEGKAHLTETGQSCYNNGSVIRTDDKKYAMYDGLEFAQGGSWLLFQPYMLGDINADTGEKYDAKYWESYVPEPETSNALWEAWQKDYNASQIQTYLEERGKYTVCSEYGFMDEGTPKSWDMVSKIIVQGSWDAVYAESEEGFSKCIEEMRKKATRAGYRECMKYSARQVKQRWN